MTSQFPNFAELKKVTIIPRTELERIKKSVSKKQIEQEKIFQMQAERAEMIKKSKEKSHRWENTLINKRLGKINRLEEKEAVEEEKRKEKDRQWSEGIARENKDFLEEANKQIFYQTDRVKNFHSGMLLSEIYDERNKQLELKELKKLEEPIPDGILFDYGEREEREAEEKKNKDLETQDYLFTQMKERDLYKAALREEDKIEGETLQKLAVHHQLEETRKMDEAVMARKEIAASNVKQMEFNKSLEELKKSHIREEEMELRKYAKIKEKMLMMRNKQVEKIKNEKIEKLEAIKSKMTDKMLRVMKEENQRMENAIQESEEKYLKRTEGEKTKKREMMESIVDHIEQQRKLEEEKCQEDKREKIRLLQNAREADLLYQENSQRMAKHRYEKLQNINKFNKNLLNQRLERDRLDVEQTRDHMSKTLERFDSEEAKFLEYANGVMEEKKAAKLNLFPMKQAVKEEKPQNSKSRGNTYARLGFVW